MDGPQIAYVSLSIILFQRDWLFSSAPMIKEALDWGLLRALRKLEPVSADAPSTRTRGYQDPSLLFQSGQEHRLQLLPAIISDFPKIDNSIRQFRVMKSEETNMTKRKNQVVEKTEKGGINKEDPSLCSLPQDLLLSILDKYAATDLKSLFQCSLVSKHFASVVSHVPAVSFTIPSSGDVSHESWQNLLALVKKVHLPSSEQVLAIREFLSSKNLNLPTFLEKLQDVKSIHLEYVYPPENGGMSNFSSPKWKVEFNDSGKIEIYAALLANSVRKVTEDDPSDDDPLPPVVTELMRNRTRDRFWLPCMRYIEWMCLTYVLVKDHTSLECVTIIDSEKHSKLVTRGEDLLKFRSSAPLELLKQPCNGNVVKMARVPVLHLPLSGYVIRWASLLLATSDEDRNVREMVFKDTEDDDLMLVEAIKEILENHVNKVWTIPKSFTSRW